jgi:large subunit ribosomal protein L15
MPIHRRLPKRGFRNIFHKEYQIVNLKDLARCGEAKIITPELLREEGIVKKGHIPIKVLGEGTVAEGLLVRAHAFSDTAKAKIQSAKGTFEVIST